jgi:hypothetical protein
MPRSQSHARSGTGVSMLSGTGRRAAGAEAIGVLRSRLGVLAGLALSFAGAGCATDGNAPGMAAMPAAANGPTVAFESIDGPPVPVFQKLVVDLSEEAQARQITVVSREGAAAYRVRGFLAVHIDRGKPQVAWVWDVYDADKRRTLRISGEEPGARKGADAWAAADDQMLRRIARQSVDRLAAFLSTPPDPAAPAPTPERARVATANDAAPAAFALAAPRP